MSFHGYDTVSSNSFNELKNYLESIYMIFDGRGGRRWSEVTEKQHNIALSVYGVAGMGPAITSPGADSTVLRTCTGEFRLSKDNN